LLRWCVTGLVDFGHRPLFGRTQCFGKSICFRPQGKKGGDGYSIECLRKIQPDSVGNIFN
jgi:hypothetical protein